MYRTFQKVKSKKMIFCWQLMKRAGPGSGDGSGSVSHWDGSEVTDPYQNVTDPYLFVSGHDTFETNLTMDG
jgi:hypothetical protein